MNAAVCYEVGYIERGSSPVEFTLRYKGPLPADGGPKDKHKIRQAFHPQLFNLWKDHPLLSEATSVFLVGEDDRQPGRFVRATRVDWISMSHRKGGYRFVPLVSNELALVCSLDIQFLRREPVGSLVKHGGDIDNRMKTLLDALRIPDKKQISKMTPELGEDPFFCLLEDDALITGLCVKTDRLLDPIETKNSHEQHYVALNITVKVSTTLASETEAFNRLKGV
jgi:hypothetical protein